MMRLFLLTNLFLSTFLLQATSIHGLLPENKSCGDWLAVGQTEHYQSDELYFLINGGADLYLEYGFKEVVAQSYQNNANEKISVEIYDMGSSEAAFGIYSLSKSAQGETANLGDFSVKTSNSLLFTSGSYLVLMRSAAASASVREGFCLLAESILNKNSAKGDMPALIDHLKLNADEVRYVRGPIGLSSVYYFDATDLFQIEEALVYPRGDTTLLYFAYTDALKADKVFEQLKSLLPTKTKFTLLESRASAFSLKDKKERILHFTLKPYGIEVALN
ncbi:MAG: DUF6599 family protein [Salinivirgaceae bacterium]